MKKWTLTAMSLSLLSTIPVFAGGEKCSCPSKTATTVAYCKPCGGGVAFTHKTSSQKLIGALQGQEADPAKMKCSGCKDAAQAGSSCCGKHFVDGKVYTSPVSAALARGQAVDAGQVKCGGCKSALDKGQGYCDHCNVGVLHGIAFKTKEHYEAGVTAHTVLTKAIDASSHCEACAVAMVTDGECEHCKVKFKGGQMSKSG